MPGQENNDHILWTVKTLVVDLFAVWLRIQELFFIFLSNTELGDRGIKNSDKIYLFSAGNL